MTRPTETEDEARKVQFGPVTVFFEDPPAVPSIEQQAKVVGQYLMDMAARMAYPNVAHANLVALKGGNVGAVFVQYTDEFLEQIKQTTPNYSEEAVKQFHLPGTEQLLATYLRARVFLWAEKHGQPLEWKEWDAARLQVKMTQNTSIAPALRAVKARSQAVTGRAHATTLATAAMDMPGRTEVDIQGLAETLVEELFLTARIVYLPHLSQAIKLPTEIPSWVWHDGLFQAIPGRQKLKAAEPAQSLIDSLVVGTHVMTDHMRSFLSGPHQELRQMRGSPNKSGELSMISRVEVPNSIYQAIQLASTVKPQRSAGETLEQFNAALLARKEEGASLLKVHLDLMDQAFESGGSIFRYDLREAAPRLGFKQPASRRGYDLGTLRELYARVLTLNACKIEAYEAKGSKKKQLVSGDVPYWVTESSERLKGEDELEPYRALLPNEGGRVYVSLLIRPGLWWPIAQMNNFHLRIPRSILKLNTSGKGNEVNRIALKLAASLAVWERINTTRHGGGSIEVAVRHLAEKASIFTAEELVALGNKASRARDQLSQAFEVLKSHDAFDVTIIDLKEYDATGRGWIDRFLDAKLSMAVRVLETRSSAKRALEALEE